MIECRKLEILLELGFSKVKSRVGMSVNSVANSQNRLLVDMYIQCDVTGT